VLDSWQALGFMKPEMRDFYTPGCFEGLLRSLSDLYNNEAPVLPIDYLRGKY